MLDTYIESEGCECHRVESGILPHLLALLGLLFSSTIVTMPLQLALLIADGDHRVDRADRVLLFAVLGAAMPLCYLGAYKAIKAQSMLIRHLSPESGEVLKAEAKWSWWRAPLGFLLFNIVTPVCGLEGYWSSSVVWSRVRYSKRRGRLSKVERIGAPFVHVALGTPPAVRSLEKLAVEGRLFSPASSRRGSWGSSMGILPSLEGKIFSCRADSSKADSCSSPSGLGSSDDTLARSSPDTAAAAEAQAEAEQQPPPQTKGHDREHNQDEIRLEVQQGVTALETTSRAG